MSEYQPFPSRFNGFASTYPSSQGSRNSQGTNQLVDLSLDRTNWTASDLRRSVEAGNCVKLWSEKLQEYVAITFTDFDANKWSVHLPDVTVYTLREYDLLTKHQFPTSALSKIHRVKKIFKATIKSVKPIEVTGDGQ